MPLKLSERDLRAIARSRVNQKNFKRWTVIYIALFLIWFITGYLAYIGTWDICIECVYIGGWIVLAIAFIVMIITDYISRQKEFKLVKEAYGKEI